MGLTASIFSDDRFRGYSLSQGHPVGILDFAYDDPSDVYADVAGTGVLRRGGGPEPLGLQLTGGYAKRLSSGTTIDFGITHSTYSHYSSGGSGASYTELYAGVSRGGLSSRLFLSPHYSERGLWTAYGELDGTVSPGSDWSLDGHVGMLVPLRTPADSQRYRTAFDWRVGVTRTFGRVSVSAAWTEGARGRAYYNSSYSQHALVVGASLAL